VEGSLTRIEPIVFDAIWRKAKEEHPRITERAVYDRIQAIRKEYRNTISPRMAAFVLASTMDIDVYRIIKDKSELDELRSLLGQKDLLSRTLLRNVLKETIPQVVSRKRKAQKGKPSRRIFIVHGRDLKPVKELKTMLETFGLKPIVLHEQPSGSITVFEKLWKYSNVGYVFVILTPDDVGYCQSEVGYLFSTQKKKHPVLSDIRPFIKDVFSGAALDNLDEFFTLLKERARQNVVLEFGYFVGFLGPKKVFCLYKGDFDLPSDMRGILHAQFKKSVKEAKEDIVRELKGAHYDLHVQKAE
jgi:predicted nucleotide-binding protein